MTTRVGEWVEVRSKEEILATLDKTGRLGGVPFMPEMFQFCGKRFKVYKSAHKTCDFVYTVKARSVANAVHLPTRCDGKSHGGCQHACLLYWKSAWLKELGEAEAAAKIEDSTCTEEDVYASAVPRRDEAGPVYMCQGTEVVEFSSPLAWWDVRQYLKDYSTGNVGLRTILNGLVFSTFRTCVNSGFKIGKPLRWLYDLFASVWGRYPQRPGLVPKGQRVPWADLNLQPGELVRVKSHGDILKTVDTESKSRGMSFDAEMVPFCGKEFRVRSIIETFIDEKSGRIRKIKNRAVSLEGPICLGKYSDCRMLCPRSIIPWWREIWLERVLTGEERTPNADQRKQIAQ